MAAVEEELKELDVDPIEEVLEDVHNAGQNPA